MRKSTLCWKCQNTCGGCSWSSSFKPVENWIAKKTMIKNGDYTYESYLVIDCPKFEPLKVSKKKVADNKIDWFLKFKPYETAFTKDERKLVGLYLNSRGCDVAKEFHMSARSVQRELHKIKQKLERLEERQCGSRKI